MFTHEVGSLVIEEEDQCYTCSLFNRGIACPLLETLGTGFAKLTGDTRVSNCGFYVKHKRNLRAL